MSADRHLDNDDDDDDAQEWSYTGTVTDNKVLTTGDKNRD